MLTEDWMMRQVDALARSIAYLVFQKDSADYVPGGTAEDAALDELHRRLLEKVNAGDIGGAEDLLFAESDPGDRRYLELAVDFYARLNDLTDAQLEAAGFGRDELEEGLRDMADRFGVTLL